MIIFAYPCTTCTQTNDDFVDAMEAQGLEFVYFNPAEYQPVHTSLKEKAKEQLSEFEKSYPF